MQTEIETAIAAYQREREIVRERAEAAFSRRLDPRGHGDVGGFSPPTLNRDATAGRRVVDRAA
jgi:hypothetical protein